MVDVDKAVMARLDLAGEHFEILVDCEKALAFKQGKSIGMNEILASDEIYSDVKKGEHAPENLMKKLFGTNDKMHIAAEIIKKGEVQLTTQYKAKLREEKLKQIVQIIHRNAVDPKTGSPHPPQRIERAVEEAKVKVDEFKSADEQVQHVLHEIRHILPIKFELREIAVRLPAQFAGKSYHILKEYGKMLKDEWQRDGSLVVLMEIPAGIQEEFFERLNGLTHGDVEVKVVKAK